MPMDEEQIEATARAAAETIALDAVSRHEHRSPWKLLERTQGIRDPLVRHRAAELLLDRGLGSKPIVYIDRSDVRPGKAAQLRVAVSELADFIEEREPQLITYGFSIDEEAAAMTVVAVHPDSASLELHLNIGGSEFRRVGEFISLREIEVFGEPSEAAVLQLREKAVSLGEASVVVRSLDAGFARTLAPMG